MLGRTLSWMCALGVAACAAGPQSSGAAAPTLAGTRWVGVVDGPSDPRTLPRLEFVAEGRLTGFTGCNMLNGGWRMEGDELRVGPLMTTKRMCAGPEGEVERRFLAAVGDGARVEHRGERLVFARGGGRFEFRRAAAS